MRSFVTYCLEIALSTATTNSVSSNFVNQSGNYQIDAMLEGTKWGGEAGQSARLDFSFPTPNSAWASGYGDGEPLVKLAALTPVQQQGAIQALSVWANVANLQFNQITETASSVGDIRFAWTSVSGIKDAQAYAYQPSDFPEGGDIWLNPDAAWDGYTPGKYGFITFFHELGHSLGLAHPFDGTFAGVLPSAEDSYNNSVMSYTALAGNAGSDVDFYPTTPMLYDIQAIQYLYGANTSHHSGNDTYTFTQGQNYYETIWDGGGSDTIVWNATTQGASIDLRAGRWSSLGNALHFFAQNGTALATVPDTVAIYNTVTIENATGGSAADIITGNDAANVLNGGAGNDVLSGGIGADTLIGGTGNDVLDGGSGADIAVFTAARKNYQLSWNANTLTLANGLGAEGTDTLTNTERLQFTDGRLALDLDPGQAGGRAALLMGAAAGPAILSNAALAGAFISYFDSGSTLDDGAALLVNAGIMNELAGGSTNTAFVKLIYFNLIGTAADAATVASLTQLLDSNTYSKAQLLSVAAQSTINQVHINLLGLAQSGIEYQLP